MKSLKITLAIMVVITIGAVIFFWMLNIKDPEEIKAPENPFTAEIEKKIEQLKTKPDNEFCRDFYKEVTYNINEFHKQNRFDSIPSVNDQWKAILEENLYAAYTEKFIKQAKTVFHGSQWRPDELKFIQAEKNELIKSKLLLSGSPVDKEFTTIQTVLNKYNEIIGFITSCINFSYSGSNLSDRFPVADVQSRIHHAASLQQNRLENEYVNNCKRLHDGLKEIPLLLFDRHVWYLDNKIDYWSNMWCNFNSHKDYSQNLNTPIRNEINDLGNSTIYIGVNVANQHSRLSAKWSADNQKAFNATFPCN